MNRRMENREDRYYLGESITTLEGSQERRVQVPQIICLSCKFKSFTVIYCYPHSLIVFWFLSISLPYKV